MRNKILRVSHPGKYVKDAIEALNMTQNEFAIRVGLTSKNLNTLINEKSNITFEVAEKLASFFDNSVDFWTNLQNRYEEYLLEEEKEKVIENEWRIVKMFDKTFLKECCDIVVDNNNKEEVINKMKKCFMVSSLSNLNNEDMYAFCRLCKNSKKEEKEIILRNSWITLAIKKANDYNCKEFNPDKLKKIIPELRKLTLLSPNEFTPKLIDMLANVGIKYIELPYLKNSNIRGVTKWIKNENAVIVAVNDYGKYTNRIWFTIFHELGHAIKNNKKYISISLYENNIIDEDELFADNFASNSLINLDQYTLFINNKDFSLDAISEFARQQQINKDIVIGRMEKDNFIPYGKYKKDIYPIS